MFSPGLQLSKHYTVAWRKAIDAEAGGSRGWLAEHGPSPVAGADVAGSCAEALLTCQQVKRQEVLGFLWVFFLKQPSLESGSVQLADRSTKKNI